jgi:hypothetical protein
MVIHITFTLPITSKTTTGDFYALKAFITNQISDMFSKYVTLLIMIFLLTIRASCQNKNQPSATGYFMNQIVHTDEYKNEQKRVDSIKMASGISVHFHIDIVDSSFFIEDKGKNISIAFINEDYPYDPNQTIYTIKFDKDKQKIISIVKAKRPPEQSDLAAPKDLVLPK